MARWQVTQAQLSDLWKMAPICRKLNSANMRYMSTSR